jgi:hypothetical protein
VGFEPGSSDPDAWGGFDVHRATQPEHFFCKIWYLSVTKLDFLKLENNALFFPLPVTLCNEIIVPEFSAREKNGINYSGAKPIIQWSTDFRWRRSKIIQWSTDFRWHVSPKNRPLTTDKVKWRPLSRQIVIKLSCSINLLTVIHFSAFLFI